MAEQDNPMQVQRVVAEVLKNHVEHDLDQRDRDALTKASRQLMNHAQNGLWIGSLVGATLAFRGMDSCIVLNHETTRLTILICVFLGRWREAARAARRGYKNARAADGEVFYPNKATPAVGAAGAASKEETISESRRLGMNVRFMLRGLGLGLLGTILPFTPASPARKSDDD